ncbi:MAG: hypothetical protein D6B25_08180 [Desulfobulbaceae bacterium]|nr:MAG: hypothetical protein D6B25_08180 [Desulfobulbaceae bacterium]
MQCERLINLAKSWYISVKEETMAPARMVQFIKQHVAGCPVCQEDPDIQEEIEKITEIILPESKIPKAVRMKQEQEAAEEQAEINGEEEEVENESEEDDDFGDEEENEEPLSPEEEEL